MRSQCSLNNCIKPKNNEDLFCHYHNIICNKCDNPKNNELCNHCIFPNCKGDKKENKFFCETHNDYCYKCIANNKQIVFYSRCEHCENYSCFKKKVNRSSFCISHTACIRCHKINEECFCCQNEGCDNERISMYSYCNECIKKKICYGNCESILKCNCSCAIQRTCKNMREIGRRGCFKHRAEDGKKYNDYSSFDTVTTEYSNLGGSKNKSRKRKKNKKQKKNKKSKKLKKPRKKSLFK